jgi:uncharacterized protein (DUF1499 family)
MISNTHLLRNIDFQTIQTDSKPNQYIVIPLAHIQNRNVKPENFNLSPSLIKVAHNKNAPVFPGLNAAELKEKWEKVMEREPRVQLLDADESNLKYCYVHKSKLFKLPDYVTVQFLDLIEPTPASTLMIYSKSKYGFGDFGANKNRVKRWLEELRKEASTA